MPGLFSLASPARIALLYLGAAVLWVFVSDLALVRLVSGPETLTLAQTLKAWGFIAVTAGVLYLLMRRLVVRLEAQKRTLAAEQAALRESERRWRLLIEKAPIAIGVHQGGRFVLVNEAMVEQLGYARDVLTGMSIEDAVHPDDLGKVRERLARLVAGEEVPLFQLRCIGASGNVILAESQATLVQYDEAPAVQFIARDVTAQRRMEDTLRLRDRALASAGEGIIITDPHQGDDPIIYANPAFERITGYRSEEVLGRNCRFLQGDDRDQEGLAELRRALAAGRPHRVVLRNYRKDGTLFWNELTVSPVRDVRGRITHFVGIQNDVTLRRQAEQQLQQRNKELAGLLDVSQWIAQELDLDALGGLIVASAAGLLPGAEVVTLWLYDEQDGRLRPAASKDEGEKLLALGEGPEQGPVGDVYRSREPVLLADGARAVAAVPILGQEQALGVLAAGRLGEAGAFGEHDLRLLQSLAGQAAVALQNGQLFRRVRDVSRRLLQAQEMERRRLGRELHDEVGGLLTTLQMNLKLNPARSEAAQRELQAATELVATLIDKVRNVSLNLRPSMLDDQGLSAALEWLVGRFSAQTGIRVAFRHEGCLADGAADVETAAFRIVQEALTNVARHAGTDAAQVIVRVNGERLTLHVIDEGAGFDPEVAPSSETLGLATMRERADLVGGRLQVASAPGAGTVVSAWLPLSP